MTIPTINCPHFFNIVNYLFLIYLFEFIFLKFILVYFLKMNKSKVDWNDQYNINIKKEDINIVRQDNKLSLRKNNLQQLLLKKRNITDKNHDIKIEENEIIKYLPLVLITDFDIYDEKLEIIYNFLNKDFSSLKQHNYSEINVIYFCLLKLEDISFDLNFSDISVKNLE